MTQAVALGRTKGYSKSIEGRWGIGSRRILVISVNDLRGTYFEIDGEIYSVVSSCMSSQARCGLCADEIEECKTGITEQTFRAGER